MDITIVILSCIIVVLIIMIFALRAENYWLRAVYDALSAVTIPVDTESEALRAENEALRTASINMFTKMTALNDKNTPTAEQAVIKLQDAALEYIAEVQRTANGGAA